MISDKAIIDPSAVIHPTAVIYGNVKIGADCYIGAYSVIGSPPEHREAIAEGRQTGVLIRDNVRINEYVTVSAGVERTTTIRQRAFIQRGAYISHDTIIGNMVTVSCNVLIGGHSEIDRDANLGLGCIIHQRSKIREGCMIGMGAVVTKSQETQPYKVYVGSPAKYLKDNEYLINKLNTLGI